ncbi:MAG: hypothetical protein IPG87_08400 [Saprospiraceae bacterium]|nr:hypothetical protein [Candidatus Vicinibacter affinis]
MIVDTTNFFSGTGQCSYQIIIKEGSNEIEIHTGLMTQTTSNKVQGIENATGTLGLVIPGRNNTPLWSGIPDAYKFSRGLNYVWSPTNYLNNNLIKIHWRQMSKLLFTRLTVTASNGCSSSGSPA